MRLRSNNKRCCFFCNHTFVFQTPFLWKWINNYFSCCLWFTYILKHVSGWFFFFTLTPLLIFFETLSNIQFCNVIKIIINWNQLYFIASKSLWQVWVQLFLTWVTEVEFFFNNLMRVFLLQISQPDPRRPSLSGCARCQWCVARSRVRSSPSAMASWRMWKSAWATWRQYRNCHRTAWMRPC